MKCKKPECENVSDNVNDFENGYCMVCTEIIKDLNRDL